MHLTSHDWVTQSEETLRCCNLYPLRVPYILLVQYTVHCITSMHNITQEVRRWLEQLSNQLSLTLLSALETWWLLKSLSVLYLSKLPLFLLLQYTVLQYSTTYVHTYVHPSHIFLTLLCKYLPSHHSLSSVSPPILLLSFDKSYSNSSKYNYLGCMKCLNVNC